MRKLSDRQKSVLQALSRGSVLRSRFFYVFSDAERHIVETKGGKFKFKLLSVTFHSLDKRGLIREVRKDRLGCATYYIYAISTAGKKALKDD